MATVGRWLQRCARAGVVAAFLQSVFTSSAVGQQTPPSARKSPPPLAARASAPAKPSTTAGPQRRSGAGWSSGPVPAWVVSPPARSSGLSTAPAAAGRRDELLDVQYSYLGPKPQFFVRVRSIATDASTLGNVSQAQIQFNPVFQTVVVHGVTVLRDGVPRDRLRDARIELMRREQRLEQQILDGRDTLLVVVPDVRIGEAVEVSYTIEGANPIFEGRVSAGMQLAHDAPVDVLHYRMVFPSGKVVHTRGVGTDVQVERLREGNTEVLRVVREQVPAITVEQSTPPWFPVVPVIDVTDYASWPEVDAWASRLFAPEASASATVVDKANTFRQKGLTGEALVSEVLRFVQDEVRYLSVSLGESSHRPKPAAQTLAELVGDCKDKVVLFNALLRELGFTPRVGLVSIRRNRGVLSYLPSPDLFDHVISLVDLDGRTWYLDPTVSGQGTRLASRGRFPYGAVYPVGSAADKPQLVPAPPTDLRRFEFNQRWDFSRAGEPVRLEMAIKATGAPAEQMRTNLSSQSRDALQQGLASGYARVYPDLKTVGEVEAVDDRENNVLRIKQAFELREAGSYSRGALEVELLAFEMFDTLVGPADVQRRSPFYVTAPGQVLSVIDVQAPVPFDSRSASPVEVVDRQFRYSASVEYQGARLVVTRRYERLEDEVAADHLRAWREKVMQARQSAGGRIRLPLVSNNELRPELERIDRRMRGGKADGLRRILVRQEVDRLVATQALMKVVPGSPLAAHILEDRAVAQNLLGEFAAGQADAEQALAVKPDSVEALDAKAVALFGQGRAEEALATFERVPEASRSAGIASWMGAIQLYLGRPAAAEALLRSAVSGGTGDEREFALIWLFLAAEQQGGRGRAAVEAQVEGVEAQKLTGAILRYFVGQLSQEALLKRASASPEKERLDLAEANFFIGQRLLAQGAQDRAVEWFRRTVETGAVPYREVTFAKLELARRGR